MVVRAGRSEKLVVVVVALLRRGMVYVPVDGEQPRERVDYIVGEVGAKVVITGEEEEEGGWEGRGSGSGGCGRRAEAGRGSRNGRGSRSGGGSSGGGSSGSGVAAAGGAGAGGVHHLHVGVDGIAQGGGGEPG